MDRVMMRDVERKNREVVEDDGGGRGGIPGSLSS